MLTMNCWRIRQVANHLRHCFSTGVPWNCWTLRFRQWHRRVPPNQIEKREL